LRKTASLAVVAALAMSGIASAEGNTGNRGVAGPAKQACKQERATGPAAFKEKYANKNGKRAFQRCVRQHLRSAAKGCRAERKADRAAFKAKYGNKKGKHAFRRCVRQHSGDPVAPKVPVS